MTVLENSRSFVQAKTKLITQELSLAGGAYLAGGACLVCMRRSVACAKHMDEINACPHAHPLSPASSGPL